MPHTTRDRPSVNPESPIAEQRFRTLACAAAFAALVSYAAALTITPASLNEVAREFGVGPSKLGGLFLALTIGFLTAITAAGRFSDVHGKLPFILTGCVFVAVGLCGFGLSRGYAAALVSTMVMGMGGGFSESTAMALVGDLYTGRRRTAMLNWAQALFGVGAVLAPVLIASLLRMGADWRMGYYCAASIPALSAALALWAALMRRERPVGDGYSGGGWRDVMSDRLVAWCSVGILLYVGTECGVGHWLAKYFRVDLRSSGPLAASSPAVFWAGVTAGRAAGAWASKYVGEVSICRWAIAMAGLCQVALLVSGSPALGLPAAAALGFFLGPIFPTIVSLAGAAHPSRSGAVTAVVVFSGAVGSAIFPPLVGTLAEFTGLRPALWMCAVALAANLAIFVRMKTG